MFGLSDKYEQLWRAIIRPPRAEYTVDDLGTAVTIQDRKYSNANI